MKKILLIIIDGLSDKPIPQLGNKTPLEAAQTQNLDFLAKKGVCGLINPFLFPRDKEPTSEGTHIALLGYKDYFLGRGLYEAFGAKMKIEKGDLAFRVNFATVDKTLKILDRRAGRIEKTQPLISALSKIKIKGAKFLLKKSYGHRAVLILSCLRWNLKQGLSAGVSDCDPKRIGEKVERIKPLDNSKEAKFTAEILNEFLDKAHQILKNHPLNKKRLKQGLLPANYLLIRGPGMLRKVPSFKKKYGLKAGFIAGGTLYKGIAKNLGMREIKVKGTTGLSNTNLKGKISAAKRDLKKYNFIFLHIKATDTFSHDGNFLGKKKFIEKIDKNLKAILKLKNTLIVVTADHSTCSLLKRHCKEPIPVLIYGKGQDIVKKFSEKSCQKGKLGKINQLDLMPIVLGLSRACKN